MAPPDNDPLAGVVRLEENRNGYLQAGRDPEESGEGGIPLAPLKLTQRGHTDPRPLRQLLKGQSPLLAKPLEGR